MPKIAYVSKKFSAEHMTVIANSVAILEEYVRAGYDLTLRQLYYQHVARDLIPNNQRSYKRLGGIISDARMAGLIDWNYIVDRTRNLVTNPHWDSPSDIVEACASQFRLDRWADQPNRIEVWIEKDALVGVIERTCKGLDVPFFSCRGYTSMSEAWGAGRRLGGYLKAGQQPVVVHLGDHDPSGIDMTRDVTERLSLFAGGHVQVERIALNMDQVEEYGPPPNPAKVTDSRAAAYIAEYGEDSWELDALEPQVMNQLITDTVGRFCDDDRYDAKVQEEEDHKRDLQVVSDHWEEVVEHARSLDG